MIHRLRDALPLGSGAPSSIAGLQVTDGIIKDEYNPDLEGVKWFEVVEKMRNHSRLLAVESLINLPILSTVWTCEAPDGAGTKARVAAKELEINLFSLAKPFTDIVRLGILSRFFGVRVLEPRWNIDGDRVLLLDLLDLAPQTYYKWRFENGEAIELRQRGYTDKGQIEERTLDLRNLLRFTWREEKGNPQGRADYRGIYGDWFRADFLDTILMVGAERAGVGVIKGTIPRAEWERVDFRNSVKNMLQAVRSRQSGAIVLPDDVVVEALKTVDKEGLSGLKDLAEFYRTGMAVGALMGILETGMHEVGTQALASVQLDYVIMVLDGTAKFVADNFTRQIIRRWMVWNYPGVPVSDYPFLKFISTRFVLNREAVIAAINAATTAGNLPVGALEIEEYMRERLGLPERIDDGEPAPEPGSPEPDPEADAEQLARRRRNALRLRAASRYVTQAEIEAERKRLAKQEDRFSQDMREFLERIRAKAIATIEGLVDEYAGASDLQRGVIIQKVMTLELSGRAEYERLLTSWLRDFYQKARTRIASELPDVDADGAISNAARSWINVKAEVLSEQHYAELRSGLRHATLEVMRAGLSVIGARQYAANEFRQKAGAAAADLGEAGQELIDSLNAALVGYQLA